MRYEKRVSVVSEPEIVEAHPFDRIEEALVVPYEFGIDDRIRSAKEDGYTIRVIVHDDCRLRPLSRMNDSSARSNLLPRSAVEKTRVKKTRRSSHMPHFDIAQETVWSGPGDPHQQAHSKRSLRVMDGPRDHVERASVDPPNF
jgi:hypothetical protein